MKRVQLMGILNVTPDSFSDGGKFLDPIAAVDHALQMVQHGANIIDMGAESTRPGSTAVKPAEQLNRLLPVLKAFRKHSPTPVSIDTQSATVARACLDAGATIINDISALRHDPAMLKLLAKSECDIVLMHMQGTPKTMQRKPTYRNVVAEVLAFLQTRIRACERAGIERSRLIVDPGIGFGKTLEHNLAILQNIESFAKLKTRLLLGVSRKKFLGALTGEDDPANRTHASVVAGVLLAQRGADILRVHDVAEHAQALRIYEGIRINRQ